MHRRRIGIGRTHEEKKKNEVESEDGLGSVISWHNTAINAMDGDAIFRSLLDESGKYLKTFLLTSIGIS
jgi:hypothetical protein